MLKRNWGRIVFISSESGVNIPVEMIHYGVTKTAQIALARGLAETTAGTNVTVNSVLPGPTRSEGVEQFVAGLAKDKGLTSEQVERRVLQDDAPTSLIKRFETPEEVAAVVAFLCGQAASAINGAAIRTEAGCSRASCRVCFSTRLRHGVLQKIQPAATCPLQGSVNRHAFCRIYCHADRDLFLQLSPPAPLGEARRLRLHRRVQGPGLHAAQPVELAPSAGRRG